MGDRGLVPLGTSGALCGHISRWFHPRGEEAGKFIPQSPWIVGQVLPLSLPPRYFHPALHRGHGTHEDVGGAITTSMTLGMTVSFCYHT